MFARVGRRRALRIEHVRDLARSQNTAGYSIRPVVVVRADPSDGRARGTARGSLTDYSVARLRSRCFPTSRELVVRARLAPQIQVLRRTLNDCVKPQLPPMSGGWH